MENKMAYEINSTQSSLKNNILLAFFLILTISGSIINLTFPRIIIPHLSSHGLDRAVVEHISREFVIMETGITIAGILIVLCIALFLSSTITRPLNKLTRGLIDIAQGKWRTRIDIESNDEFEAAKEYTDNIVVSVPSILIVLSNRLNILSTNAAFDKLSEYFSSISLKQFLTPLKAEIQKNLETGELMKKEIRLIPEGSKTSLIFSAIVSRIGTNVDTNGDEEKASVLLTITDITENRKMKELVLQSKQDWEDTFNTIPDMITVHDRDYNIINANSAAKEMLNLPLLDLCTSNKCYKYYHGSESAPEGCPSCSCYETKKPAAFEIFEPHLNKFIEIRAIPRMNDNNELIGLIHIVRDISLRKKIEHELDQLLSVITKAKIEWELTFDSVAEFLIIIDNDLKISKCNSSFAEFTGKPAGDLIGKKCYDFFPCSRKNVDDCKNLINSSYELLTKNEIKTESGRWLYISHHPIRGENKENTHSVIIATEVTDLKIAQQRIRESEEELKKKVNELEKFYDMAIGRELKMKELKKEIKNLNDGLLKDNKYGFAKK
jgi:PAS domain S-box-containing protein